MQKKDFTKSNLHLWYIKKNTSTSKLKLEEKLQIDDLNKTL